MNSYQPEHQTGHGEIYPGFAHFGIEFNILRQATLANQPSKGALHHPATGQDLKTSRIAMSELGFTQEIPQEMGIALGWPKGVGRSKLDKHQLEIEALLVDDSTQKFIVERYGTTEVIPGGPPVDAYPSPRSYACTVSRRHCTPRGIAPAVAQAPRVHVVGDTGGTRKCGSL